MSEEEKVEGAAEGEAAAAEGETAEAGATAEGEAGATAEGEGAAAAEGEAGAATAEGEGAAAAEGEAAAGDGEAATGEEEKKEEGAEGAEGEEKKEGEEGAEEKVGIKERIEKDPHELNFLVPLPEVIEFYKIPKINDARSVWRLGMRKLEETFAEHIANMHLDFEDKANQY